jgi:PAS domain S-box-containing protein
MKRIEKRNAQLNKIIRRQTEKLEKSSQLKEEFLKQVPEPLIILDSDKNKIQSNELYDELIKNHEENDNLNNSFKQFLYKIFDDGINNFTQTQKNTFEINSSFKDIDYQLKFNAFSLQDDKIGTAVIVRDISHIKKAEMSIKKSEDLFRSYFEKSPIGIIYIEDPTKAIVNCNQKFCDIVKMSKDEIVNKTMMDLTHPEDLKKDIVSFLEASANQEHYLLEPNKRLLCKGGSIAITETHVTFIYDNDNNYQYMFALIHDVTEQRENQKKLLEVKSKLMQSEKLASLGQITAGVAHEINNPVNFIYNGVNNLKRLIQKDETEFRPDDKLIYIEIQQMISAIEEGARRTSEIVKSLRMFTKIDVNNKTNYDIIKGIESTLLLLSNRIQDRISIQKKFSTSSLFINCFPSQLNQVFMNILSNSIDAIQDNGTITISIESDDSHAILKFHDTGSGIPKDLYSKVFEPFFSTKGAKNGTGLGLSISHSIIEKHKGTIAIKPNNPTGTTFIITLPK